MYPIPQVQIPNPPPPTQFQRNPLIEALLARVIQGQVPANPLGGASNLGLGGGGGGQMPFNPAQILQVQAGAMDDQKRTAIEAMLQRARAESEMAQARHYDAQATTEEGLFPGRQQEMAAKVEAWKSLAGNRDASAARSTAMMDQINATTDPKVKADLMRAYASEALGIMREAETETEKLLQNPLVRKLLSEIAENKAQTGAHDARANQTNALTPGKIEGQALTNQGKASDVRVKESTEDEKIGKTEADASVAVNKAKRQKAEVMLRLVRPELERLRRLKATQAKDGLMLTEEDQALFDSYEALERQFGVEAFNKTEDFEPTPPAKPSSSPDAQAARKDGPVAKASPTPTPAANVGDSSVARANRRKAKFDELRADPEFKDISDAEIWDDVINTVK